MVEQQYILLAEDDPQYALVLRLGLEKAGLLQPVAVVYNTHELIAYLAGEGVYQDRTAHPLPGLIVLALPLPLMHDFRALRWIRSRREFDSIPVVVLAGFEFPGEEVMARKLGADFYAVKPLQFRKLVEILSDIRDRIVNHLSPAENQAAA